MTRILALALVLFSLPLLAQEKMAREKWDELMAVYGKRAALASHKAASEKAAELATEYPKDRELQIFCAMTAYYCAHRLLDKEKEKKAVALRGLKCAERLLESDPNDYDGRFWSSMTSFKSKSADGIRAALKEANRIKTFLEKMKQDEPKRFEAYMMLGTLYRELPPVLTWGDPKKGVELLEEAARLVPLEPEVLLELAAAYAKVGDKEKARATYRKCIDDSKVPANREWETDDARAYARKMLKELGE